MKILMLHLSDMHISNKAVMGTHAQQISNSLNCLPRCDYCYIIISGDISMKGAKQEFFAADSFLRYLFKLIKASFPTLPIRIFVVPGNHDVDLSKNDYGRAITDQIFNEDKMDDYIASELHKQINFLTWAKKMRCFTNKGEMEGLFCRKVMDHGGFRIEINLINSALFSTLDSDKGNHYLPDRVLQEITKPSGADFVVSIMHHAPEWFCDKMKMSLEKSLSLKSSLVFLGHEHTLDTKKLEYQEGKDTIYLHGGRLGEVDTWINSDFFASVLDTDKLMFVLDSFMWNEEKQMYQNKQVLKKQLSAKPSVDIPFPVREDFLKNKIFDSIIPISGRLIDYYVFPRLSLPEDVRKKSFDDIIDVTQFDRLLEEKRFLSILGGYRYGKSAFAHYLFYHYIGRKVPIICSEEDIYGKQRSRVIRNVFEEIYGDDQSLFMRFQQLPPEQKIMIIDNGDNVKAESFNAFLDEIENEFGYVIVTTKDLIELDVVERTKTNLGIYGSFTRLKIEPLYADKRKELVSNLVRIINPAQPHDGIIDSLCTGLTNQRHLVSFDPEFVVKFVMMYCNSVDDILNNDTSIFSKVFEANLTLAIQSALRGNAQISVDKVFNILARIAYRAHKNAEYPIAEKNIIAAIEGYIEYSGDDISTKQMIDIACRARILHQSNGLTYEFSSRSYYAYFVALAIIKRSISQNSVQDIKDLIEYSCFSINADVLLFITYLTDSADTLMLIVECENRFTESWMKYSATNNNIPYLQQGSFQAITMPSSDAAQKELVEQAESEKAEEKQKTSISAKEFYNYDLKAVGNEQNQCLRAIALLNIIARSLPCFEHDLSREQKIRVIQIIYELPNQIFYMWAKEIDAEISKVIALLSKLPEDDYQRAEKISNREIFAAIQEISLVLLLELYNLADVYSVRPNTLKFLDDDDYFDYRSDASYRLQHLIMYQCAKKTRDFIEEAIKIKKSANAAHQHNLIDRIAYRFMIKCAAFTDRADMQRLIDSFFRMSPQDSRALYLEQKAQGSCTVLNEISNKE